MAELRFSDLSGPRRALIRLCQLVNYGAIVNVTVEKGELSLDRLSEVPLDFRLEADLVPRKERPLADFVLPAEICRLLAEIDAVQNGVIEKITVHDGLPRRLLLRRLLPHEVIL